MEPWDVEFLEWSWGIPREASAMPRGAQGSLEVPKGSPESWDSQRLGIPWLPGWAGLVGLAQWKARWAAKNLFGVSRWDNM